jgi:hypothetical protein
MLRIDSKEVAASAATPASYASRGMTELPKPRPSALSVVKHLFLGLMLLVAAVALAVQLGALRNPLELDGEALAAKAVLVGYLVAFLAQLAGAALAFRVSAAAGLLSIFIPGYVFFVLNRSGTYWYVVGAWLMGIAIFAAGVVALS